jgi:hypothetical protein
MVYYSPKSRYVYNITGGLAASYIKLDYKIFLIGVVQSDATPQSIVPELLQVIES